MKDLKILMQPENTNLRGRINVRETDLFQLLCLCWMINSFSCLVKSKPVKQEVSHSVIHPPMVSVLWFSVPRVFRPKLKYVLKLAVESHVTDTVIRRTNRNWIFIEGKFKYNQALVVCTNDRSFLTPDDPVMSSFVEPLLYSRRYENKKYPQMGLNTIYPHVRYITCTTSMAVWKAVP